MVIVRISFVCALVRACVEPRGAPNRANESALRNSRAYTQSSLFAKPRLEKVKTKRENPGESKVINNFPSSHCRAMWCRSIRIYAKRRRNEKTVLCLDASRRCWRFLKTLEIVRQCERIDDGSGRK